MTTPIKNSQVSNDPYADPYADCYGDSYEDPYGSYYGDEGMEVVDPYADQYADAPSEESPPAPLTTDGLRQYVADLEDMLKVSDLSESGKETVLEQLAALDGKVNVAVAMSATAQEKVLAQINEELVGLETQILSGEETGIADGTMKSQIDATRAKAEEYLAQGLIGQTAYDKAIDDLTKAEALLDIEGESETGSPQIQKLIDSAQDNLVSGATTSDSAQKLADITQKDPDELTELAEQHGLDLDKLPNPPTQEVIEFLMEASPDLAGQFQAVEDGIAARDELIEKTVDACNKQNAANTACTSDNDNMDMSNFQKLYDLKYHQDSQSKDIMNSMQEANGSLVELLKSVYPDDAKGIKLAKTSDGGGWEAMDKNYLSADKISFGGQTLDIFNSTNGKLRVSTSADSESEVDLVTVQYDWDGSGDWEDHGGGPLLDTYGEGGSVANIYDEG